jgi:hypothetical protein
MRTILAGLALTTIIALVVPLAVLRAGVWRQEYAASLTCRPRRLSIVVARHADGMQAHCSERTAALVAGFRHADRESCLVPDQNESAVS